MDIAARATRPGRGSRGTRGGDSDQFEPEADPDRHQRGRIDQDQPPMAAQAVDRRRCPPYDGTADEEAGEQCGPQNLGVVSAVLGQPVDRPQGSGPGQGPAVLIEMVRTGRGQPEERPRGGTTTRAGITMARKENWSASTNS